MQAAISDKRMKTFVWFIQLFPEFWLFKKTIRKDHFYSEAIRCSPYGCRGLSSIFESKEL
jgi:hypothetical protein